MSERSRDRRSGESQPRSSHKHSGSSEAAERERLKEIVKARLAECGWREQLKEHCKEVVDRVGVDKISLDDLVAEITPKARSLVPDDVKRELLSHIRDYLVQTS